MSKLKPLTVLRRWMRYRHNLKALARLDSLMPREVSLNRGGIACSARHGGG